MNVPAAGSDPVASVSDVRLRYGKTLALDRVTLEIPAGRMVGFLGPDGVGKSSLLSLLSGARVIQHGLVRVLGGDMAEVRHREDVCPQIAYMPQGLGKNLYPTLSVEENLQFFARLFGHNAAERRRRIDELTHRTGLSSFLSRPAGKLSGGMKQKLGLCCALIHDPDLLILDEPTTGVDPLARLQFWDLIRGIRLKRRGMSVIVATAYMDEAQRLDWLVAMDGGKVLATGSPADLMTHTGCETLDAAFIALLPEEKRREHRPVTIPPFVNGDHAEIAIEATNLTMRFGDFVAVDRVSFRIRRGEIFGFLGSNGCGKSTTMKMLTGLLSPSEGSVTLLGHKIDPRDLATRRRVGYMSQGFSLYSELSVRQNLILHARLFHVERALISARVNMMIQQFGLVDEIDSMPDNLPLGIRQRLSLAVAMVHQPELLILDEPTSGVDPIARDSLWQLMIDLSRNHNVTIFVSTHFMNEAARCDRISLMSSGRVLVTDVPAEVVRKRGVATLEEAFISYLKEGETRDETPVIVASPVEVPHGKATVVETISSWMRRVLLWGPLQRIISRFNKRFMPEPQRLSRLQNGADSSNAAAPAKSPERRRSVFSFGRAWSCSLRETLELKRDPMRATMALLGAIILLFVCGNGISFDVENLTYAVLDQDQTILSQNYALNLSGSRYFTERPPLLDYADLDRQMRSGKLALAIEIAPGFGRDFARGVPVQIAAWVDSAMPQKAETVQGYVQGMHQGWLREMARLRLVPEALAETATIETRFRYNPDVKSLPAIVPATIPLLLLMIPAILTALSVVSEKELGSIINLYVTPVTRCEFLLGKQLPYVALGMLNFGLLTLMAVTLFGVPVKGSFLTLTIGALIFVVFSTGFGLFASTFTRSQIGAIFMTMLGTMIPAIQFAGMVQPVSSLEGVGAIIGRIHPSAYFLTICRGVFNKALGFSSLRLSFWPLLLAVPIILGLSIVLLKKQET